jgi:hypothetical protein
VTLTSVLSACDKGAQWPKAMALLGEVLRFTPMPGQQVRDRWKSTRNGGVFKAKHNKYIYIIYIYTLYIVYIYIIYIYIIHWFDSVSNEFLRLHGFKRFQVFFKTTDYSNLIIAYSL